MNLQNAGSGRKGFESEDDPTNDIEHLTLACVLFDMECLKAVIQSLEPRHFANHLHGALYEVATQRYQASGELPRVSEFLKAFEGTRDHDIAPTKFLLDLRYLSDQVASVSEARSAARGVIEASFVRERCGFIGKDVHEISEVVADYQARCARLTGIANDNQQLLAFYDPSVEVTAVAGYVVKGLIPQASTTALHGVSGAGKTFIARDLACSVASGSFSRGTARRKGRSSISVWKAETIFRSASKDTKFR